MEQDFLLLLSSNLNSCVLGKINENNVVFGVPFPCFNSRDAELEQEHVSRW